MFRGFVPNVIKNDPNKSVQLTTFDVFKRKIKESEKALEEEKAIWAAECKASKGRRGGDRCRIARLKPTLHHP